MTTEKLSKRLIYFFGNGHADAGNELRHLVGGKGASLAEMTKAGLNVPPGFTISAECCDLYFRNDRHWPEGLDTEVRENLARLEQLIGRSFAKGEQPLLVAVRSGAAQSMPGMMDTILNVGLDPTVPCQASERLRSAFREHTGREPPAEPWEQLRQAINAVFDSWTSDRAVTYRKHHQIDGLLGTAVNVQAMCPAEVAGVMFTANPVNPGGQEIIIESVYGLGEDLVLGKVAPERFVVTKEPLEIIERSKSPNNQAPSLSDAQLQELARLGLRVEKYFGHPCDIEWALANGDFCLLQSRPINKSALSNQHSVLRTELLERVRQEEIAALAAKAEAGGTVWSRFNLAEILPAPTPMTWAIVRRLMSGRGGFGMMYRDLGFDPDPALDEEGVYDLVCGRPYCNLSREPRMQYRRLPFEHNFAALKANPQKALYPQPVLNPARGGWRFWLFLPVITVRLVRSAVRLRNESRVFAARFRDQVVPVFLQEVGRANDQDLSHLETPALLARLDCWIWRTLCDFARESLKPTVFAALAMGNLERALGRSLGPERTRQAVGELVMGIRPDPEADLASGIRELTAGQLDRAAFLERFGHRGYQEMELAQPRWAEEPTALERLATTQAHGLQSVSFDAEAAWNRIAEEAKLSTKDRARLDTERQTLSTYMSLRETAKHHLLKGYALIRRILVELDRRYDFDGGIFFLEPSELPELHRHEYITALIAERRRRREIALSLEMPQVLFSDDLEAIGRPPKTTAAETFQGVPISAGVAEGAALVLQEPNAAAIPTAPYILVCPSTDPAWLPLFVQARGLVMETGGMLSHGAIVAREFGLPAVAGIPDVQRRIHTGQRVRVDGRTGNVSILA